MKTKPSTTLVYSTETGRICPDCSQPVAQCQYAARKRVLAAAIVNGGSAAAGGVLRVQRETKGRGGKCVTLVRGLVLADSVFSLVKITVI